MSFLKMVKGAIVGVEEPKYEVVNKTDDYEQRSYQELKIVTLHISGKPPSAFDRNDYKRLFEYINGKNDQNVTYDLTSPVLTLVSSDEAQSQEYGVSFILPASVETPAKPNDEGLILETLPARKLYSRRFAGMAKEADWKREYEALKAKLEQEETDMSSYTRAGYDPPFKPFNRRNEVWISSQVSLQ